VLRIEAVALRLAIVLVECSRWDLHVSDLSFQLASFDGSVIWPVKVVFEMTSKVSSGTLSLYVLTSVISFIAV